MLPKVLSDSCVGLGKSGGRWKLEMRGERKGGGRGAGGEMKYLGVRREVEGRVMERWRSGRKGKVKERIDKKNEGTEVSWSTDFEVPNVLQSIKYSSSKERERGSE